MRKKNTDSWLFIFWSMPETGGNSFNTPFARIPFKISSERR